MNTKRGFTIVELMVTIAIFAILAAIAGPSLDQVIRTSRVDTDIENLMTAMSYARSEAITRAQPVSIVPTGTSYADGWRIFTDQDTVLADCTLDTAKGETLLRVQQQLSRNVQLFITKPVSPATVPITMQCVPNMTAPAACITFQPRGDAIFSSGDFSGAFCMRDAAYPSTVQRGVTINSVGQAFLVKVKN